MDPFSQIGIRGTSFAVYIAMKPILLLFLALSVLISSGHKAHADSQPKTVVVSDIDDTIRLTRIHPLGSYLDFFLGLFKQRAFVGMPSLYSFLQARDVRFEYVSGTPQLFSFFPKKFLQIAGFPVGNLSVRPDMHTTIEEFKYNQISKLMRENPTSQFILVGDNGQRDVATYRRLRENPELSPLIKAVYIHKIYSGNVSMELAPGQNPFFTAADLAVQLSQTNLVNEAELNTVLRSVEQGLEADFREVRQRARPDFMQLSSTDVDELKMLNQEIPGSTNYSLFQRIIQKINPISVILCAEIF